MSRGNSRRGLPVLVAAGVGITVAALVGSERLRGSVRRLWLRGPGEPEPQEPSYLELPDRGAGRDDIDRAVAEGMTIADEIRHNGAARGAGGVVSPGIGHGEEF